MLNSGISPKADTIGANKIVHFIETFILQGGHSKSNIKFQYN